MKNSILGTSPTQRIPIKKSGKLSIPTVPTQYTITIVETAEALAILDAWKKYLSLQNETSNIPHLNTKLAYYAEHTWSIYDAWEDFQRLISKNAHEIQWEAGRGGFNISDFKCNGLTFTLFRRMISDMAVQESKIEGQIEDSLPTVSEIVDATKDRATDPKLLDSCMGCIDEIKNPDMKSK